MARGQLALLAGLGATLALLAAACTKINPAYCEGADHFQCVPDGGADVGDEPGADTADVTDAMPDQSPGDGAEVAETATDGAEAGDGGDADVVPVCTSNLSCAADPAGKTICDPSTHACRGCRIDDECTAADDAGVCLAARCVPKKDVILVDSEFTPCMATSPIVGARLCDMAGALTQARGESRRIIVVANAQGPWTDNLAPGMDPKVVTVVGRKTAHFRATPDSAGITLTGVEVVLRGIQVEGSAQKPGIVVNGGAIATLEQVRVSNSIYGVQTEGATTRITIERSLLLKNGVGLSVNGAEFTVRNTVIADSASTGAEIFDAPAGKTMRFQNNTLFNNPTQLTCTARAMASALLIFPASASALPCAPPNTVNNNLDPMFDSSSNAEPYHLTAASPCRNMGDSVDFSAVDIDGEPRPMGTRSDCGADEFRE